MNNINFDQTGGFPLTTNILSAMQDAYKLFNELGHLAGNNSIITGYAVIGNNINDGVIVINNELLPFKGGLLGANSTVVIKENVIDKTFEDSSVKPVLFERYATIGIGGTNVLVRDLKRNANITGINSYLIVKDYFMKYESPKQSFDDHADFFKRNPRYTKALTVKNNANQFIEEIAKAGYATDPNYANTLKSIIKTIEKYV